MLGTVVGWVSDLIGFFANGVSKVANFFAGIFGGAKDSSRPPRGGRGLKYPSPGARPQLEQVAPLAGGVD